MKRVLIITYYWPPNGGAGVQRWLKMSKYLPQFGWQPVVYTPSNPEVITPDAALLAEVPPIVELIKRPIAEPYAWYKRLTGRKADEKVHLGFLNEGRKKSWRDDLAVWVRGNAFVPDARVWWVNPSVRFLERYLREHPVDAIVSTGPPHSMHLIALGLKKRFPALRWIADWRDPWTNIDFYPQLKLTAWADRKHHRLERAVIAAADANVVVGWTMADEIKALGSRNTEVITNGYDPADVPVPPEPVDEEYSLVHVGSMTATRDVPALWQLLADLCASETGFDRRLKLRFIGAVDHAVLASIEAVGLGSKVERIGSVDHAQAMRSMQRARVLLLSINDTANAKGVLTSKLFEYLSVGRPIIAVGPGDGDVGRVLRTPHLLLDRARTDWDAAAVRRMFGVQATASVSQAYTRVALAERMGDVLGGE
ncbi:MAG: glycosyl transferase family 1 [Flavobacteriales bacterium]|nr:glycosyl transferase family 1 [Flavobacteriales bacterium]